MKKLSIALSLLFYACIPPLCPDVRRESPSGASSGGRARTRPLADIPPYVAPTLNFDLTQCVYPSNLSNSRSGGTVYLQRDSHTTFVAPTAWLCENRDDGGGWATWIHDTFTNYITQPFDFSSLWTVANTGTVSTNIAVAPDGTSTADRVLDTDATNNYSIRQTGGVSSTVPNASSIWVQTSNTPPNISGAGFATNIGVSIATLDNNWLRIPIVYSKSASLPANLQIFLAGATSNGSGGLNFNGSATGGYNLWGAQAAIADADVPLIQGTTTASNVAVNGSLSSVVQSTADFHVQVRHLMDPQFISLTSGETLYPFSLTTPDGDSWVDIATNVVANAQINGGGAGTHSFVTFNYGAPLEMGYELFSVGSKNVSGMNLWIQGCRLGGPNSNRNTAITFQAPSSVYLGSFKSQAGTYLSRRYTMWNLADTSDVDRAEGIMMGDSITAPYIGNLPTICAYIYTLQESRTRPGILMHAAPGYTISQQYAIWTSPTLNPYATNSMVKWASLQLGINNAGNAGGSQTEAQMATDMQTFVNRINSDIPSAKVLLIPNTPCRAGGAAGLSDAQWAQLSAFNNDLLGTGAHPITGSNIVRMPLWSAMDDGTGTLQSWANSGDGVHITAAARQYEAAAIRLTLQQNGLL